MLSSLLGNHYNNHPSNVEVRHWIGVRGYNNYGSTLFMWDPAGFSVAVGWAGVMPYFNSTPTTLFWYERQNGVDNSRGYVW